MDEIERDAQLSAVALVELVVRTRFQADLADKIGHEIGVLTTSSDATAEVGPDGSIIVNLGPTLTTMIGSLLALFVTATADIPEGDLLEFVSRERRRILESD